jgi:ABC-type transport system involved in multi-copper enzyme maturation permease subunit
VKALTRELVHAGKRSAVALAVVLVAAAGLLVPAIPTSGAVQPGGVGFATSYNYSGQYNFVVAAFNGLGQAVAGTAINVTFSFSNQSGSPIVSQAGVTNSRGLWDFSWIHSACRCTIDLVVGRSSLNAPLLSSSGEWTPLAGAVYVVSVGLILGRPSLLVSFSSTNGDVPPGTFLSYCIPLANRSAPCSSHFIGNVTENPELFHLAGMPPYPDGESVNLTLSAYGGRVNQSVPVTYGELNQTNPASVQLTPIGTVLRNGVTLLPLFAALAGVLVGYGVFIQERSDGSIEPLLALPVTRWQVISRRFCAGVFWTTISSALASIAVFFGAERVASVSLPSTVLVGTFAMVFGVGAIFLGLAFLAGSLARTSGTALAILLVLASILTVLWDAIAASAVSVGQFYSAIGPNPAQAGGSLGVSILNLAAGEPPAAFSPAVEPAVGAILLAAWVGITFVVAWLCFRYRD